MKPILILQNDPVVPPGTITGFFEREALPCEVLQTYETEVSPRLSDYRAVLSLGATASANDYLSQPPLTRLFNLFQEIVSANHPFLGICFSSQLMAMALGAEVRRHPVKEIGCSQVKLLDAGETDPIFEGCDSELTVFQWHSDSFQLPESAELLASSEVCQNQAYRSGNIVGLQFHPEVDAKIAENWSASFPADLYMTDQTRPELLAKYEPLADVLAQINYRLLGNFVKTLAGQS